IAVYRHLFGDTPSQALIDYYSRLTDRASMVVAIAQSFEDSGIVTQDPVYDGTEPASTAWIADGKTHGFTGTAAGDLVSYAEATSGVTASLLDSTKNQGFAQGDTYTNIENLSGSAYDDTLIGDKNDNVLDGGNGVDTVSYADSTALVTVNLV